MKKSWKYFLGLLLLILILLWAAFLTLPDGKLRVIACDAGQGDAFLVTQGTNQILFDGGLGNEVLACISNNVPFWDKKIEAVVLSHPQKDHFGGLIDVFESYNVGIFVTSGLDAGSQDWRVLENAVGGSDTRVVFGREGIKLRLSAIYLDILHPTYEFLSGNSTPQPILTPGVGYVRTPGEVSNESSVLGLFTSNVDPNEFSLVVHLGYGNFDALFTGDIGPDVSDSLAGYLLESGINDIEYLKVPHHGSKNGMSLKLLEAVEPEVAVISAGKGNSYGHPHAEIIKMLRDKEIKMLRTDEMGEVGVVSDGERLWIDNLSE